MNSDSLRSKIILVDDIQSNLDQGKNILKTCYDVYPAPSAARLFEMLEKIMPDLILLDIGMPEMDGYETIKILKADERYNSIPVIFLTAKSDNNSEYRGLDLGAADYVSKPFSAPLLLKRIENQLLIVRKTRELEAALTAAQSASVAKGSFLANMSHEIRTPMNAIIGMTGIAAKSDDIIKIKYCLSMIENSSTHLLGIINDILDISKIEAGKLELDYTLINLKDMLIRISDIFTEKVEAKNIKLDIIPNKNVGRYYMGDSLRLSQVITNLLSNAVKFTPDYGRIELTVDKIKNEEKFSILRFAVNDTGIGMTEEQMGKLFNSFVQAENGISRKFGGTGLGLAISKSIVEKMDGKIWVESEINKGSSFIFEVKLDHTESHGVQKPVKNIPSKELKILIVDDDIHEKDYIKIILNSFGMAEDEAENLEQAVRLTAEAKKTDKLYDVVFIDYTAVNEKTLDLIKDMTADLNSNKIVIMSSFLHWNKIESVLKQFGVDKYIAKPLFPSAILDLINEVTGGTVVESRVKPEAAVKAPDFSNVNLLFAEDVDINREIFISLMEETKINIDTAENGLIAVEKFKENPDKYDMIITDIQMPVMDGFELAETIRALGMKRAKTIPVIAMTANVFKEDIDKCLEAGMNDHLAKPIELKAVIDKIKHYCSLNEII